MTDRDCVRLLQESLPRLGLRWAGYRKVRSQICRRVSRRIAALGLTGAAEYLAYLGTDPAEWTRLDSCCRITISRFFRDKGVFRTLAQMVLPELVRRSAVRGEGEVRYWSAGCASGEEPYTLSILWRLDLQPRFPDIRLSILATDVDAALLERARNGLYSSSSLKEMPASWQDAAFAAVPDGWQIRQDYREAVRFVQHDLRTGPPPGVYDLILCRNLAFTYFDDIVQRAVLDTIGSCLRSGGALVTGIHESLPSPALGFEPWADTSCIYRKQ